MPDEAESRILNIFELSGDVYELEEFVSETEKY